MIALKTRVALNALTATADIVRPMAISPSPSASARSADHEVDKEELREAVHHHRRDVRRGMERVAELIVERGKKHDWTKLNFFDEYFDHFKKMQAQGLDDVHWANDYHFKYERHHIEASPREDVNLIDILEHLIDGIVAGKGRYGRYKADDISSITLQKAYKNTQAMLADMVQVGG